MSRWSYSLILVTCHILCGDSVSVSGSQQAWSGIGNKIKTDKSIHCLTRESSYGQHCRRQDLVHQNVTVVTALFDIGRDNWPHFPRSYEDYLSHGEQLLSMDINLVIFIEPKGKKFVEERRRGKESRTVIHVMDRNELPYAKLYLKKAEAIMESAAFKANHQLIKHPEGFSPWYNIIVNSKLNLIYNAILLDTFNSTFYSWIDFGYGHGNAIFPASRVWNPQNIMTTRAADKITYIKLHDNPPKHINDVFKKIFPPYFNGGFFAGSRTAMLTYNNLFNKVFKKWFDRGIVDDDQTISFACYQENQSLFNLVKGDWYDMLRLFH